MTSDDISSSFPAPAGACNVHRRVEEKPETREARGGACKLGRENNFMFYRSEDDKAVLAARA